MDEFLNKIAAMNRMYHQPVLTKPTMPADAVAKIYDFHDTLLDEVGEAQTVADVLVTSKPAAIDSLTDIADWLADIVVYCFSEAAKYGIPLDEVLDIVMASNMSKLGVNGQPIFDERGKFLKGPNYWAPEPTIRALLEDRMEKGEK